MVRKLPAPSTVTNPVLPDKIDVEPPRTTNARTSALLDERTSIENVTIMRRPEVPLVRPLAAERYKVQFTVGRERVVDDLATQHSLPPASDLARAPLPRRRTRRMPFTNPRFRQTALVVHVQLAGDQAAVSSETARQAPRWRLSGPPSLPPGNRHRRGLPSALVPRAVERKKAGWRRPSHLSSYEQPGAASQDPRAARGIPRAALRTTRSRSSFRSSCTCSTRRCGP